MKQTGFNEAFADSFQDIGYVTYIYNEIKWEAIKIQLLLL